MTVIRIPGCYTHPWLLYPYTHPWLLSASLVVIRIPGWHTHPWLLLRIPGRYTPP